tara:strand:+ start:414 stop:557 length:144 start_codon:yes stop_codon:yes gene_type:complete
MSNINLLKIHPFPLRFSMLSIYHIKFFEKISSLDLVLMKKNPFKENL